jgi:hypothetical protein
MTRQTIHDELVKRLKEKRRFMPVLAGPRLLRKTTVAIEVKSGRRPESRPGMEAFATHFKPRRKLLVGGQGIELTEFLARPAGYWLQ